MSTGSLATLVNKSTTRNGGDLSSTSLADIPALDSPSNSPPRRPPLGAAPHGPRHVLSRVPSEAMNDLPSLDTTPSVADRSRMRSYVTDVDLPDESVNLGSLDTPSREKRFEETNGTREKRPGRASLGAPAKGQMTLREQEKVIDTIKKDNFSLKLKVHLLEERLNQLAPEQMQATLSQNIKLKVEVHSRGVEIKKLKKLVGELQGLLEEVNDRDNRTMDSRGADVKDLEDDLDAKDEEIRELKKRLRAAESKASLSASSTPSLSRLQEEFDQAMDDKATLQETLLETNEELERLRAIMQRQKENADEDAIQHRLRHLSKNNDELKAQLDDYEADVEEREEEMRLMKEHIEQLQAQLDESERRRHAENIDRSASRAAVLEEREDKALLEQNANDLRDKLAAVSIELEQKELDIEELQRIIDDLEARAADDDRLVEDMQKKLDTLEADRVTLQSEIEQLQDQMDRTIQHLQDEHADRMAEKDAERDAEIRSREEEIISANAEIDDMGKRIWALEEELEVERDEKERVRKDAADQLEEQDKMIRALKEKILDRNGQIEELREMYEDCRQQIIAHADRSRQIEDQAQEYIDEADAQRNERQKVEDELQALEEKFRQQEAQLLEERERRQKDLEDAERKRRRDAAEADRARSEAIGEAESLKKQLRLKEEDVAKLQSALNDLEDQSKKLGETHTTDRFGLELQLERAQRDLQRAQEDVERLQKEAAAREEKNRERENAIDKLHVENRDLSTQLAAQTQARLNVSEKLDIVQGHAKSTENELAELRARHSELEKRLSKDQRQLQAQENSYRDQLTERNTLLLTIYQYLEKILGAERTPKKGTSTTRPVTNFAVFHEDLMNRIKAIAQIQSDFEKKCKAIEAMFADKFNDLRKQLDHRWKQLDRFEAGVKSATEKREALRKQYQIKVGELDASKASNADLARELASLKRINAGGPLDLKAAEQRGIMVRAENATRQAAHASNLLIRKDEELVKLREEYRGLKDEHRDLKEKMAARIKELERIKKTDEERIKQEKQGAKESLAVSQKENEVLRNQLLLIHGREEKYIQFMKKHNLEPPKVPPPDPSRRTSR